MDLIGWVQAHWKDIVAILLQIIGGASIVVKLTPSPKDDTILEKVKTFVSKWIALNPHPPA